MVIGWFLFGVAVIYLWVRGAPLARWLVFSVLCALAFLAIIDLKPEAERDVIMLGVGVVAWLLSGIPIYVRLIAAGWAADSAPHLDEPFQPHDAARHLPRISI